MATENNPDAIMTSSITITRPDDWHLHLRDGPAMQSVVAHTAAQFGRAIVMPNLAPPVTTVEQAIAYRERILAALPANTRFDPLMTLYLTDHTSASEIHQASRHPNVHAVKLYPAHATTNSSFGVSGIDKVMPALEAMSETGLPLLVHGEVTHADVDVFDREKIFIDTVLMPLTNRLPNLRIVLEHITTRDGVEFVKSTSNNIGGTITAHHLLYNRNALFKGGIRPHYYCLPVLKREPHRVALVEAATSGNPKFFLGTDSAPHAQNKKENACGCAGIYTAHAAIELYAEAFEQVNALPRLESFASHFGPDYYGLPRNQDKITLVKQNWTVPERYAFGEESVIPLRATENIAWKFQ